MSRDIVRAAWREQRNAFVGWGLAWCSLVAVYAFSWPAIGTSAGSYDALLDDMPEALRALLGSSGPGSLSTPAGYLTAELLSVTGPLMMVAMGVLAGTRALAGEEEAGSLELLLAQPVRRTAVLLSKLTSCLIGVTGVLLLAGVLLVAVRPLVGLELGAGAVARAMLMLGLLSVEALALGLALAALTGSVGRSRALAGAVTVALFVLHALGPVLPALTDVASWSPFHTVLASDPFRQPVGAGPLLALALPAAAMTALAVLAFRRRDLHLT
jgi:ABC-2 type transport system permease protein